MTGVGADPADRTPVPTAYYTALGDGRYTSTEHAQGAWSPHEQHMAPVAGVLVHELERCAPRADLMLSRVTFDILGMIPAGEFLISARVIRPGRTIELVQAEVITGGRPVVRATAWRLARSDTSAVAGTDLEPLPGPDTAVAFDSVSIWPGGYIRSLEVRRIEPAWPGRSRVWLRTPVDLVDDGTATRQARLLGLVDTANGVATRSRPGELLFPNTDLTIHLFREPTGEWLGLDTEVSFGPTGVGLTGCVLHDTTGPFGRAAQTLTLRAPPPAGGA